MKTPQALPIAAVNMAHASGEEVTYHSHQEGQLTLALAGTIRIQSAQGWWLAMPGTAIWIPANMRHRAVYTERSSLINLRFAAEETRSPRQVTLIVVSGLLMELAVKARALNSMEKQEVKGENIQQLELIRQLLFYQLKSAAPNGLFMPDGSDKRLRFITSRLRNNPSSLETLAELSGLAYSSQRTIARLFEQQTGMNFTRWRERLRIITAIERLLAGQSIVEAAMEVGFQSASSFTTAFSRVMGVAPRQYLRQFMADNKLGRGGA